MFMLSFMEGFVLFTIVGLILISLGFIIGLYVRLTALKYQLDSVRNKLDAEREYNKNLVERGSKYYYFVSSGFDFIAKHSKDEETLEEMKLQIENDKDLFTLDTAEGRSTGSVSEVVETVQELSA